MAASGKKKGKVKGKTVNLTEFLSAGENSPAPGTSYVYSSKSSWADEAPDRDDYSSSQPWADSSSERITLPTAPKSAQVEINRDQLPDKPPYTVYLGNLPFDCSTEDIKKFLSTADCNVSDVRLPTDGDSQRLKGFGYAEVSDLESLYKALALNHTNLSGRRIKVDLASHTQTDGKGGDRGFDKTASDWRRSDNSNKSEWNQGGDRDRYSNSNSRYSSGEGDRDTRWRDRGGSDQAADSFGGGWDRGGGRDRGYDGDRGYGRDRGGGYDRDRGGYDRNNDRGGGGYERNAGGGGGSWDRGYSDRGSYSHGSDRSYDRGPDRSYNRGPDRSYDRGPDRGYDRGSDRGYDRGSDRGYDRGSDRGYDRGSDRGYDRGSDRGYDQGQSKPDEWRRGENTYGSSDRGEPPRERKKLVLQKRTQPLEQKPSAPPASSSSIFGGAKPVDTAAKEREIEERLAREKREAEQHKPIPNVEKEAPWREGQEHGRVRRDSERSEGREGRTRHSSSGSGRGGPRPVIMRRESERSNDEEVFHKDDQAPVSPTPTSPPPPKTPTSPRQDDVKLIPAPPPKENAWAKRSETVAPPPAGSAHRPPSGSSDRPYGGDGGGRRDNGGERSSDRPRGGGRGGGTGAAWGRGQGSRHDGADRGRGGPGPRRDSDKRGPHREDSREGPAKNKPQAPLPKYEEPKPRDWSDSNKFSSLLEDELGNLSD